MLLTLGMFWLFEGLGFKWPIGELSALPLFCLFSLSSWLAIQLVRRQSPGGQYLIEKYRRQVRTGVLRAHAA